MCGTRGLEGLRVDLEAAARRRRRGRRPSRSRLSVAPIAAGGVQHHLGAQRAAVVERRDRQRPGSSSSTRSTLAAEAQRDAAVAQVVDELVDHLAVDERGRSARGSTSVTCTSSAVKIVAYSTPMTLAPTTVRLRGTRVSSTISSLSKMLLAVERRCGRAGRARADGDQECARRR